MNKTQRLEQIRRLIMERSFSKQSDLVEALKKEGVTATQATISRDMDELGVIKLPDPSGGYRYSLADTDTQEQEDIKLPERSSLTTILAVKQASLADTQILALSVVPGTSRLVKRLLLETYQEEVLAVIADDDTLLVFVEDKDAAQRIKQTVEDWVE